MKKSYVSKRKKATPARKSISNFGKGGNNKSLGSDARNEKPSPTSSPVKKKLPKLKTDEPVDRGVPEKPPSDGTKLFSSDKEHITPETPPNNTVTNRSSDGGGENAHNVCV